MASSRYGKIRPEDILLVEFVIDLMKRHGLQAGLHGTSLFNNSYKDIDMLVIGKSEDFIKAMKALGNNGTIIEQKGGPSTGHEYIVKLKSTVFRISHVVLL